MPEQVLDLYAGMGGFGTGFGRYFSVSEAVDYWKDACQTYQANHRDTAVRNTLVEEYLDSCIPKDFEGMLFTGVIGGPPCQEFSMLNQKSDLHSLRSNQVFVFLEAVKKIQPDFAMMENVASIPKIFKERAISILRKDGYKVVGKVILAHQYGSVQKRRRWILTASKRRHIFPSITNQHRTANEILMPKLKSEMNMREETREKLQNLPSGKWVALPGKKWKAYFIVDPTRPLPAIVNVLKNRIVRPDRTGYLSLSEILQAQGFSHEYKMTGTISSKAQQLANAIPVELAETFAKTFFKQLHPDSSILDKYFKK